ncbi:TonB-dependent receptor [Moorena bouillonii]|nr:TonB-dependent receptor [Moorena bouillonii]
MKKLARCYVLTLVLLWTGPFIWAQSNSRISLDVIDAPLSEVLESLESNHGIICSFDNSLIYPHRVTAKLREVSLDKCMKTLLKGKNLDYQAVGRNHIIIVSTTPIEDQLIPKSVSTRANKRPNLRSIYGQVKAKDINEVLELATVRIKNKSQGVNTDAKGNFRFNFTASLNDSVEFSYVGYESYVIAVKDLPYNLALKIELLPSSHSLEGITIERGSNQSVSVSNTDGSITINPSKTGLLGGLGESDVFRVVQLMPGVSSVGESSSGLNVRGGTPDQNLILFDGMPVYQAGHFFGLLSIFNSDAVQEVVLHRSAMDAKYGGRASGVIEVTGKPLKSNELKIGAGLNLLNASAFAEIPLLKGKGALLIAGRRSYSELGESALSKSLFNNVNQQGLINFAQNLSRGNNQFESNPLFSYSDLNLKFTYRPSDRDYLTVSHYRADDQLVYNFRQFAVNEIPVDYNTTDFLDLRNSGTAIGWRRQWNGNYYSRLNISYSTYTNDYTFQDQAIDTLDNESNFNEQISNDLYDISLRFDNTWEIDDKQTLEFGVQSNYVSVQNTQEINSSLQGETDKELDLERGISRSANILSFYAQYRLQFNKKLSIQHGLRHSFSDKLTKSFVEPRASIIFKPNKNWKLKVAAGRHHQFVNRIEASNPFRTGQEFWTLSDGNVLPVLRSDEILVGAAYETPNFLLDVEVYRKNQRGLSMYDVSFDPIFNEQFNDTLHTHGNGKIRGLDVLVQKKVGKYTGWISYTLSNVSYQFDGLNEGKVFSANHDIRHQVKFVNMLNVGKWDFSATLQYASGRPYTDVIGYQYKPLPSGPTLIDIDYSELNAGRLPSFQRVDVSGSYKWEVGRFKAKTGLSVLNLLNHYNVLDRRYSIVRARYGHNAPRLISVDKTMLGISPNVFLQLLF